MVLEADHLLEAERLPHVRVGLQGVVSSTEFERLRPTILVQRVFGRASRRAPMSSQSTVPALFTPMNTETLNSFSNP